VEERVLAVEVGAAGRLTCLWVEVLGGKPTTLSSAAPSLCCAHPQVAFPRITTLGKLPGSEVYR
jgi:hypothetical protein